MTVEQAHPHLEKLFTRNLLCCSLNLIASGQSVMPANPLARSVRRRLSIMNQDKMKERRVLVGCNALRPAATVSQ